MTTDEHFERLTAARLALEGLSVGDALGNQALQAQADAWWDYTDDTEMAIAIVEVLAAYGRIDQDALAAAFAARFAADPERRGYGAVAYWILHQFVAGQPWQPVSRQVYSGRGSMGNGGAMRVAPVGAYFSPDLDQVAVAARLSAEVTHAHPEGQAGAIATAVAAACAYTRRQADPTAMLSVSDMITHVLALTPPGRTRDGLAAAAALTSGDPEIAARELGDGSDVTAPDTVPYALWCAWTHLDDYEGALTAAMAGCTRPTADRDTIGAIVGGIVVLSTGIDGIPAAWRARREPLPSPPS